MPPPPVFFFSFFLFLLTHRMSELRGPPPGHYASRHLRERHRPASCQYCHVLWSSAPTLCVSMRRLDSGLHPRANRGSGPLRLLWASGGEGDKQECDVTHAVPGQRATQFTGSQTGQSTAEVLMRLKQQQQQQPGGMQDAGCGKKL